MDKKNANVDKIVQSVQKAALNNTNTFVTDETESFLDQERDGILNSVNNVEQTEIPKEVIDEMQDGESPGVEADVDASDIVNEPITKDEVDLDTYTPERIDEARRYAEIYGRQPGRDTARGSFAADATRRELFPNYDRPIKVGSYQGKVVGNVDIFVGEGNLLPLGLIAQRNKSQQKAAAKRSKIRKKVLNLLDIDTAQQFQKGFDEKMDDLLQEYGEKTNWKFEVLADVSNPLALKYRSDMRQMKRLSREQKDADKRADAVLKGMKKSEGFYPPVVIQSAMRIKEGQFDIDKLLSKKGRKEWFETSSNLVAYDNMTNVLDTKVVDNIKADIVPMINGIFKEPESNADLIAAYDEVYHSKTHDKVVSATKKFYKDGRVEQVVDAVLKQNNFYVGTNAQEKKEWRQYALDYVYGLIGAEIKTNVNFVKAREDSSSNSNNRNRKQAFTIFTDKADLSANPEQVSSLKNEIAKAAPNKANIPATGMTTAQINKYRIGVANAFANHYGLEMDLKIDDQGNLVGGGKYGELKGEIKNAGDNKSYDKRVTDVTYDLNGDQVAPQDYLKHLKTKHPTDFSESDKVMYNVLTGLEVGNLTVADLRNAKLSPTNGAFGDGNRGLATKYEMALYTFDEETRQSKLLTADDVRLNPNLIDNAIPKIIITYQSVTMKLPHLKEAVTKSGWSTNTTVPVTQIVYNLDNATAAMLDNEVKGANVEYNRNSDRTYKQQPGTKEEKNNKSKTNTGNKKKTI
tara:strand:- start:549 stop:2783 length:2235 start_codon:yes stop_codon:yes gene_type:complete